MGRLLAIARATVKGAPLKELTETDVGEADGVLGDVRGTRRRRQVTVLFREGWDAACEDLGAQLPWVTRRANLLIEGIPVPEIGERLAIGALVLQVTEENKPCRVMDAAHRGLQRALTRQWRGGVCCKVVTGSRIRVGDSVEIA
jgi:MOSC domain-containing protein YiiM